MEFLVVVGKITNMFEYFEKREILKKIFFWYVFTSFSRIGLTISVKESQNITQQNGQIIKQKSEIKT